MPVPPPIPVDPADAEQNRMTAALSYLAILFLIPLMVGRESPFVRYHLNQGISLIVLAILLLPLVCVNILIGLIPFIGWIFSISFGLLHATVMLGLMGYGVYNAVERRTVPLPVIGSLFQFLPMEPPPKP